MTELKTATEIRQMIADKRSAIRSDIDLTEVYGQINDRLSSIPLGTTNLRILSKCFRKYINLPDEEYRDSLQFILDKLQLKLEDNGFTVRPIYGFGFGDNIPRVGLVIYWDPKDLPDEGEREEE